MNPGTMQSVQAHVEVALSVGSAAQAFETFGTEVSDDCRLSAA